MSYQNTEFSRAYQRAYHAIWHVKNREKRTEYFKRYRATPKGKEATRKAIKKYEESHKERRDAWNKCVKIKMLPCSVCGETKKVHKHHPDIKRVLNVVFLCPLHHKQAHML